MGKFGFSVGALAACLIAAGSAQAAVVTVPPGTLSSNPGTYGPLDGAGTTLKVTSGSPLTTIGSGVYQGLWFGSTQASDTYTFKFNSKIDYFSIAINAMSTFGPYFESIGNFTTNASGTPTLTFTNVQYTAWDGATVTSGPADNGTFLMEIQAVGGRAFDTISFDHIQRGAANGSVVNQIQYSVFAGGGAVPELGTWALMIIGFLGTGAALRRRSGALAA